MGTQQSTLIDVRTPEEYAGDHLDGAINIPVDQVQNRVEEFREMKKPIIMYCRSGVRSGMAVSLLKQAGISEAINGGGIDDMRNQMKQ